MKTELILSGKNPIALKFESRFIQISQTIFDSKAHEK